ncbi:hypothetical protein DP939_26405 [Spongiactinospora rosea]|uniref:Uncharacterized protein n=2 Tax=Spongiactinospora rosea TaxID=2248750 RepID=A0A366LTE8_9ACTN|nr:hypothetical protein DP939_26405 [Spongiactinospora rosea]
MTRHGFRYVMNKLPATEEKSVDNTLTGDDLELKSRVGYGANFDDPSSGGEPDDPNQDYLDTRSDDDRSAWTARLSGTKEPVRVTLPDGGEMAANADGCIGEARSRLYGDFKTWLTGSSIVNTMSGRVHALLPKDPAYLAKVAEWRTCMAAKGYRYDSPDASTDAVMAELEKAKKAGEEASGRAARRAKELRIATADAECDRRVRLSATVRDLYQKYWAQEARKSESAILAYRELLTAAIGRAKQVVRE